MKTDQTELVEHTPVRRAVLALILPTVISQIITVVYNMADTFFIGQMNDPDQVAAATLSLPLFFMLTGIANLFGIGGSSLISRSLGAGDRDKACQGAAFSIWAAAAAAAAYSAVIWLLRPALLSWLGRIRAPTGTAPTTYSGPPCWAASPRCSAPAWPIWCGRRAIPCDPAPASPWAAS